MYATKLIYCLLCDLVGQDIRDNRFSGGAEAFARRNASGHGLHGDHSRHRSSDDVPSSKDVVLLQLEFCSTLSERILCCFLYFNQVETFSFITAS